MLSAINFHPSAKGINSFALTQYCLVKETPFVLSLSMNSG
jgi:hypothetical protein